ncbi:ankyrin repeat and KH domain-containing protein mask-like [Mytilus californianus]|uniref:ankyrin repeat and KH domain-containing protein mask-like n=1 Tax=Mytilus californianus TaxID=6549 RepID=UPI0022477903|nr:ankyrin repeat and KH domain-containing protein mask-like [Mytilus californianus]
MNKIIQKDNSVVYHIKVISWVVFYGHELLLRYLLHLASTQNDSPCKIFDETRSEQTRLLTLGCCSGDLDTLKIVLENVEHECLNATLLQNKEDFETKDKNRHRCKTPLTAACLHVGVAPTCISKLIKMGSNLHKMDESGHVPVFNAAFSRNRDVLKALLDANADINYGNNGDSSPLFTATSLNHLDAVKILIEFGASVKKGKSDNTTPLFRATERGNLEIARFLVEKGADVNLCDNLKRSPLHGASRRRFRNIDFKVIQEQHCQVVKLLLNNGARVNATDKYNRSPLFLASKKGYYELVDVLLQHDADPNIVDSFRRSPRFVASQNEHTNIVNLLLKYGAYRYLMPTWSYQLRKIALHSFYVFVLVLQSYCVLCVPVWLT